MTKSLNWLEQALMLIFFDDFRIFQQFNPVSGCKGDAVSIAVNFSQRAGNGTILRGTLVPNKPPVKGGFQLLSQAGMSTVAFAGILPSGELEACEATSSFHPQKTRTRLF